MTAKSEVLRTRQPGPQTGKRGSFQTTPETVALSAARKPGPHALAKLRDFTRRSFGFAAVAAVVAALSVCMTAGAASSGRRQAAMQRVIHITRMDVADHFRFSGKNNTPVPGDSLTFAGKSIAGSASTDAGTCSFVTAATAICTIQENIYGMGRIEAAGTLREAPGVTNRIAILGGTGQFATAGGWILDKPFGPNASKDHLTLYVR